MAKQWGIRFKVKGVPGIQTQVVTNNSSSAAKKLVQAQYGSSFQSFLTIQPVK